MFGRRTAVLSLALTGIPSLAHAEEFEWIDADGGTYTDEDSWASRSGGVPGASDSAVFALDSAYQVLFIPNLYEVDRLIIRMGEVDWRFLTDDTRYHALSQNGLAPSIIIGEQAADVATWHPTSSAPEGEITLAAEIISLGHEAGASGTIVVDDPVIVIDAASDLLVGRAGTGLLDVDGGAEVKSDALRVGWSATGFGTVEIAGGQLECGFADIGRAGTGFMTLEAGASVSCSALSLGGIAGATGTVTLSHPGTTVDVDGACDIGVFGAGDLAISDRALMTVGDTLAIGLFEGTGALVVSDPGSQCIVTDDLMLGLVGEATLTTRNGGRVVITGDLVSPADFGALIRTEIGGADTGDLAAVDVAGFMDTIPIEVAIADGHEPAVGDHVRVLDVAGGFNVEAFTLGALPAGLAWNVELGLNTLDVVVTIPGDTNGDGLVTFDDLLLLLAAWGTCSGVPCNADANGDGFVEFDDLLILLANWSA